MNSKVWIIVVAVIIWVLLFLVVYSVGSHILETSRKNATKKWGMEERDYDNEKWMFRFYTIAFFVGIPFLAILALIQEGK